MIIPQKPKLVYSTKYDPLTMDLSQRTKEPPVTTPGPLLLLSVALLVYHVLFYLQRKERHQKSGMRERGNVKLLFKADASVLEENVQPFDTHTDIV